MKVGVLGAGAIGCWLGGKLALAGHEVVLVGRQWLADAVEADGLSLTDLAGPAHVVRPSVHTEVSALSDCDAVLVAVKGKDTGAAAEQLAGVLPTDVPVLSCQNGLDNAERIRQVLPDHVVLAGMISFNVVRRGDSDFKRGTSGPIAVQALPEGRPIADALRGAGFSVAERADMDAVLSAKLVFNVNNAVNALSDLPLREQLLVPGYREVVAATMDEAREVLTAAGRPPRRVGKLMPALAPKILRLPTALFRLVARPMLKIDPQARSSMWEDLTRGKPTEIDDLNGTIVRLGREAGVPTPVNERLVALVREAEKAGRSPGLSPQELLP